MPIEVQIDLLDKLIHKMNQGTITRDEYKYLQEELLHYERMYCGEYPVSKINISKDKLLWIADTHIGDKLANPKYVDIVYNEAIGLGADIVHLGDFTEGTCSPNNRNKSASQCQEELCFAKSLLPKEIQTYLLLGNHDYAVIRTFPSLINEYFNCPQLFILGMKEAYVNWNKVGYLHLNHPIKPIKCPKTTEEILIQIYGHYHLCPMNNNNIDYEKIIENKQIIISKLGYLDYAEESLHSFGIVLEHIQPYFWLSYVQGDSMLFEPHYIEECHKGGISHANIYTKEKIEVNIKTKKIATYSS